LHTHQNAGVHHSHAADKLVEQRPAHHHDIAFMARPLVVGMIHGFAGSAALMLLVLSTIPSSAIAVAYILIFGIGSTAGMILMSALVSLPARFALNRFAHAQSAMCVLAGLFSLGFGLNMAYEIGFVAGLLR
jgi:high-affinity nickel-transport protein